MLERQRRARSDANDLRLKWPGRLWEPGGAVGSGSPGGPLVIDEDCSAGSSAPGRLVHGDALEVASALLASGLEGKVSVVYVDPPFASQANYSYEARLDGPADGRVVRSLAYVDRWDRDGVGPYLDMLAPRLEALTRLLAPNGTIWVHVDYRASYLVRLLLDEILGRRAFLNEIVWRRAPNLGRQAASAQFGRTVDTLVVYGGPEATLVPPTRLEPIAPSVVRRDEAGRPFIAAPRGDYTDESVARLEREGRVHRSATGKVYVKYFLVQDSQGAWCRKRRVDALWTDVPPLRHAPPAERTGFPTQKPRALLDRIVACASAPGDWVVDLFAGSGTTGESAHALGRRFILGDASPLALGMARARLLRLGAPLVIERCGLAAAPKAPPPRVQVERQGSDVCVDLLDPKEPLAWAIDASARPDRAFHPDWHSERAPGARTRAALHRASLTAAEGPIAVRVWHDDGSVGTCTVEAF
jgi:site-specific DNA-methyltransferase (adenine-specific)/adenine-specific DNA-methyltransferase